MKTNNLNFYLKNKKKIIFLFCNRSFGKKIYQILSTDKNIDLIVVTMKGNEIINKKGKIIYFDKLKKKISWNKIYKEIYRYKEKNIHIILAWWGFILPSKILNIAKNNNINLHPSYLPYGKGKYSNIWAIMNNEKYGSTICSISKKIDHGEIYIRENIKININDNAKDIYDRSLKNLLRMFKQNYKSILNGKIIPFTPSEKGSYYHSSKINNFKKINLRKKYLFLDLIKKLNASTFKGHEKPYFYYKKKKYYIDWSINAEKI